MHNRACSYHFANSKAPGHQYQQCWWNIQCNGPVWYIHITPKMNNKYIWKKKMRRSFMGLGSNPMFLSVLKQFDHGFVTAIQLVQRVDFFKCLMLKSHNSSVLTVELHILCIKPSICVCCDMSVRWNIIRSFICKSDDRTCHWLLLLTMMNCYFDYSISCISYDVWFSCTCYSKYMFTLHVWLPSSKLFGLLYYKNIFIQFSDLIVVCHLLWIGI